MRTARLFPMLGAMVLCRRAQMMAGAFTLFGESIKRVWVKRRKSI